MEMVLGVKICDKCGEPMTAGEDMAVVGLGAVVRDDCDLEVPEPEIRYACHLGYWDGGASDQRRSEILAEGVRIWAPLTQ